VPEKGYVATVSMAGGEVSCGVEGDGSR